MANTVIALKKSSTPSAAPASLANGELAINYADGIIYYKSSNGAISSISSGAPSTPSFGTVNSNNTLLVAGVVNDVLDIRTGNNIEITSDFLNNILTIAANLKPAYDTANAAFGHANAAFNKANTGGGGGGGASVSIGNTAPTLPGAGDLWWDTTSGRLYIFYSDIDSDQWVEATASGGTVNINSIVANVSPALNELYNAAFVHANSAYDKANSANVLAYDTGIGANAYTVEVGVAGNNYTISVGEAGNNYSISIGAASNAWANVVGIAEHDYANIVGYASNTYAIDVGASANAWANNLAESGNIFTIATGTAGNNYSISIGAASNTWANAIGLAGNNYTLSIGVAGNNYTNTIAASSNAWANNLATAGNNYIATIGVAGNNYANTIGVSGNNYTNSVGHAANNYANQTFIKAYAPGTVQTITSDVSIQGNLTISGNTTSITANDLTIVDSMIYLASENNADLLDIGFLASYTNSTATHVHTGLYRDHANKEYYLFREFAADPGVTTFNEITPYANGMLDAALHASFITSNLSLGGVNAISWIASSFDKANSANVLAYNTGIGANAWANAVGTAGNNYAISVGASSNAWANTVGVNTGASSNAWANTKLSNTTTTLAGTLTTTGGLVTQSSIFANGTVYITPLVGAPGSEGGEINLWGAGDYPNWTIDSYQNDLRLFSTNANNMTVQVFNAGAGTMDMQIDGPVVIQGANVGSVAANAAIEFIIDGGGSTIVTGQKGHLEVPFGCKINQWTMMLDQSGSANVEIWKDTYANFPPTLADTINTGGFVVTTATKNQGSLFNVTNTINAGDILAYNVATIATATRITISLKVTKT